MNRQDAQAAWEKIVEKGLTNYGNLTRFERVWFNVEPLTYDGLCEHYMNHGADKNSDTIEDLDYLKFNNTANQLRDFNQKYFPEGVPIGPDARKAKLDHYREDELEEDIKKMDEEFWAISEELESALLDHITKTGIGQNLKMHHNTV